MCFFRKKKVQKNEKDRILVESFVPRIDVLIELATNSNVKKELESLKKDVEYLSVSPLSDVYKLDLKIQNTLDDFKIILSRKKECESCEDLTKEIKLLVKQRALIYNK